nr:MAG: pV protein [unidentified adenovirus]
MKEKICCFWSGVMNIGKRKLSALDWDEQEDRSNKRSYYSLLDTQNPTPAATQIIPQSVMADGASITPTLEVLINKGDVKPVVNRGIKRKGNYDIATVDVNVPIKKSKITYFDKPTLVTNAKRKIPTVRLHPSMIGPFPNLKKKRKRRRNKNKRTVSRKSKSHLELIRYHPSIKQNHLSHLELIRYHPSIKQKHLSHVTYHPSINM